MPKDLKNVEEQNNLSKLKNKMGIGWLIFFVCVIITVFLWFKMNDAKIEYEKVEAVVISAKTTEVVNKNTHNKTDFYEVKVMYRGKEYNLENVHNTYMYTKGKKVTAYLSKGRLFANEEGVKTATPIATIYFIFLFGSFGMLFLASKFMGDYFEAKKSKK